jgi:hypothetical protein
VQLVRSSGWNAGRQNQTRNDQSELELLFNKLFCSSCAPTKPFCLANFYLLFCPLLFVKKRNFIVSFCGKGKLKPRRHLIILACRLDTTRQRKILFCVFGMNFGSISSILGANGRVAVKDKILKTHFP